MDKEKLLTTAGLTAIGAWAAQGLTMNEIARKLGMKRRELDFLRREDPRVEAALNSGRAEADAWVENALFRRAVGYSYCEETLEGEKRKQVIRHIPPDLSAVQFWLKNRQGQKWREKGGEDDPGMQPQILAAEGEIGREEAAGKEKSWTNLS